MNTAIATTTDVTLTHRKQPSQKQELIAANVKALIEQLEAGHSDALTAYLNAMSRFHNYSFGDVLEIARQMPTATRVAGFCAWKQLGRSVKSGEKGIRVLAAIGAAVPVRLMKRDLLFLAERLALLLDENRHSVLARQHGIKKVKDNDPIGKLFAAFLRRGDEGTLGRVLVEATILLSASHKNASQVLRDAAAAYKVDIDAIALKVKQEFAVKQHAKTVAKSQPKAAKKSKAA